MEKPEIDVSIYLRGDELQPEHVSQVLGVQPTQFQTKGGPTSHSTKVIAKIGVWALYAQTDSIEISDHIDELLKMIGNPITPLDEIDGVEEAYLDVFISSSDENDARKTVEFVISKDQLKELVRLGLCGHFTVS
jgi:hypothetical protein